MTTVSVCIPTYNHENFVAQAINSAREQVCNVNVEIVVGVDLSGDRTLDVVRGLSQADHRIRVLAHTENLGMNLNWRKTIATCRGDYIAMMDGDDFWVAKSKIQKLIDYLEAHPTSTAAAHRAFAADAQGNMGSVYSAGAEWKERWDLFDWPGCGPTTSSVVIRRSVVDEVLSSRFESVLLNEAILIFCANELGTVYSFPDCFSAYRIHDSALFNGTSSIKRCVWTARTTHDLINSISLSEAERLWLKHVFDYNVINIAGRAESDSQFSELLSFCDWKHYCSNAWVMENAVNIIQAQRAQVRRYQESASFRIGQRLIGLGRRLLPGKWLGGYSSRETGANRYSGDRK